MPKYNIVGFIYSLIPEVFDGIGDFIEGSVSLKSINVGCYTYTFTRWERGFFINRKKTGINEYRRNTNVEMVSVKIRKHWTIENQNIHIQLPLQCGVRTVGFGSVEYGFFHADEYNHRILKPNYCCYCDRYLKKLNNHIKCKKHRNQIIKCVDDALKYKLNIDCIRFVCEFL